MKCLDIEESLSGDETIKKIKGKLFELYRVWGNPEEAEKYKVS